MPRYYFHYRTDDELVRDNEGCEFADLDAAEHNAAELGKAIVERAGNTGEDMGVPRSIEITDAGGEELLYVVFWAGPKIGDEPDTDIGPVTIH